MLRREDLIDLGPTPEGFFPELRGTMENAGLRNLNFNLGALTGEASELEIEGLLRDPDRLYSTSGHMLFHDIDTSRSGLGAEWQPKLERLVDICRVLHGVILERSERVRKFATILVDISIDDVQEWDSWAQGEYSYHRDSPSRDFRAVLAADMAGTVHPVGRRWNRRPEHLSTNRLWEIGPTTDHSQPKTDSNTPTPRSFLRFTYLNLRNGQNFYTTI